MRKFVSLLKYIGKDRISEPPWDYYFLQNLAKREYPVYLAKLLKLKTGEKLPLTRKLRIENGEWKINYEIDKNRCKTFNQKIQWLKLYGVTDLMRKCTDKVAVRDYVKEKIGEAYLKPVFQVCNSFEEIDFDNLPNSFVIKCNHGCKWNYIIKNKEEYLEVEKLVEITKKQITNWLQQDFSFWCGFELQYRNIQPKILIEPLMRDNIDESCGEIHCFCFKGIPKLLIFIEEGNLNNITLYDEKLKRIDKLFTEGDMNVKKAVNDNIKQSIDLSKKLSVDFNFVRVDFMLCKNRLYFEELTFTPYSGFNKLMTKYFNNKLGKLIILGE